jgi:hypothetical protein
MALGKLRVHFVAEGAEPEWAIVVGVGGGELGEHVA